MVHRTRGQPRIPFQVLTEHPQGPCDILMPPNPTGGGRFDHVEFGPILTALATNGLPECCRTREAELRSYVASLAEHRARTLSPVTKPSPIWINLYNAGAITLAVDVPFMRVTPRCCGIPGGFSRSTGSRWPMRYLES